MKLPNTIAVGPYRYTVEAGPGARAGLLADGNNAGDADHRLQRIRIDDGQAPDMARDTLLHEVLHACNVATGLDDYLGDKEEDVARRISTCLLDVLRRNPRFTAYLLEP